MTAVPTFDRIVRLTGEEASAIQNIPNTLDLFETHFPRFAVLPGVLVLATMSELGETLLRHRTGTRWSVQGADRVRFRHFVRPGDQVRVDVTLIEEGPGVAVVTGTASVDEVPVATARRIRLVGS